jgi:hypothetical protein
VIDRLNQPKRFAVIGLILTAAGLTIIYPNLRLSIALIGIGSAIFHAGGGVIAILITPQRASGPRVFAAFGVIGLAVGMRLSLHNSFSTNTIFAIVVFAFALLIWFACLSVDVTDANQQISTIGSEIWIILLVMVFAFRSFVWTGVDENVTDRRGFRPYASGFACSGGLAGIWRGGHFGRDAFPVHSTNGRSGNYYCVERLYSGVWMDLAEQGTPTFDYLPQK